jgi:hypothetical protein
MLATVGLVTGHFALELHEDWFAPPRGTRSGAARALLHIVAHSAGVAGDAFLEAVRVTRGLMDEWDVARDADGVQVSPGRHLPERATIASPAGIESIRAEVVGLQPGTPVEELTEHNRRLMAALQDVQRQRDDLLRLNEELAETNKGFVALYPGVCEELEATNRGVVALYAELDQRTTQLRTASEAKSGFLAGISAELRAPVPPVVGPTRLLRDPYDLVVFYTDGLIQTRIEVVEIDVSRLVATVALAQTHLEAFVSRLLHQVGPAVANNDIAMAALRRAPQPAERPGQWHS